MTKKRKNRFEYYQSENDGKWYFRIVAENGEITSQSQGYISKNGALKGIRAVIEAARNYEIMEVKNE